GAQRRLHSRHLSQEDPAGRAVDSNPITLGHHRAVYRELLLAVIDFERIRATDAGLTHAARNYRGVTRHAATRRDNCLGRNHSMKVVRTSLLTHEDEFRAFASELLSFVRTEHNPTLGSARACRQA